MPPHLQTVQLRLPESLVRDTWGAFVEAYPPPRSVAGYLTWLGDNHPRVLGMIDETTLLEIARQLHQADGA